MNSGQVNIKIIKQNNVQKSLVEDVDLTSSLNDFIERLRVVQKNVNVELTKIVDQEKLGEALQDEDIQGLEDSDEDLPSYISKRKLPSDKSKKKLKA
ncbi:hypothetical protein FQR65_LT09603 [Abscondita terminalis]|nr:hypothetical protein FQR65_LT09603 [Abscondita terminalis]